MQLPTINEDLETSSESPIILNSANLENLHSINTKIMQQAPAKLNEVVDPALYHTTIPIYLILTGASVLIITLTYRRYRAKRLQRNQAMQNDDATSPGNYAEIQESHGISPSKIKIDHSNISSSLSHKISK